MRDEVELLEPAGTPRPYRAARAASSARPSIFDWSSACANSAVRALQVTYTVHGSRQDRRSTSSVTGDVRQLLRPAARRRRTPRAVRRRYSGINGAERDARLATRL
jgi:hypothetical protein